MYLFKLQFLSFLDICPGVGLLDYAQHNYALCKPAILVFKGTSVLFSIVAALIYIPINGVGGVPFLHTLSSIYYL